MFMVAASTKAPNSWRFESQSEQTQYLLSFFGEQSSLLSCWFLWFLGIHYRDHQGTRKLQNFYGIFESFTKE